MKILHGILNLFCFSSEMERRKAEVRQRLIEQSQSKKKKGFMTPERKKKLRVGCVTGLR